MELPLKVPIKIDPIKNKYLEFLKYLADNGIEKISDNCHICGKKLNLSKKEGIIINLYLKEGVLNIIRIRRLACKGCYKSMYNKCYDLLTIEFLFPGKVNKHSEHYFHYDMCPNKLDKGG